jgi:hypothetical protein
MRDVHIRRPFGIHSQPVLINRRPQTDARTNHIEKHPRVRVVSRRTRTNATWRSGHVRHFPEQSCLTLKKTCSPHTSALSEQGRSRANFAAIRFNFFPEQFFNLICSEHHVSARNDAIHVVPNRAGSYVYVQ